MDRLRKRLEGLVTVAEDNTLKGDHDGELQVGDLRVPIWATWRGQGGPGPGPLRRLPEPRP
jgi:hypothetical protein